MDTYVERVLIAQEARGAGVTVTDQELEARRKLEVDLRLQAAEQSTRMGPQEFQTAAADQGMSMDQVRAELDSSISADALRSKLLAEKLLAPTMDLGDKALRAYYERTRGKRFAAAHIAVADQAQAERLMRRPARAPRPLAGRCRRLQPRPRQHALQGPHRPRAGRARPSAACWTAWPRAR